MKDLIRRKKVMLAGIGGALLMLCIIAIALITGPLGAFAAPATTPTATPTAQAKKTNPYCTLYLQTLAKELNVPVSTLTQDRKDALKAVIAQKVKDGKLKQAVATQLEQKIDKSQGNGCTLAATGPKLSVARQFIQKYRVDVYTEIAQKLGVQPAALTAQLKAGKSLHDIASAKNVSDSQLQGYITTAIKDTLQKAVNAGALKQAQANKIETFLKNHPNVIQSLINHQNKQATTTASNA